MTDVNDAGHVTMISNAGSLVLDYQGTILISTGPPNQPTPFAALVWNRINNTGCLAGTARRSFTGKADLIYDTEAHQLTASFPGLQPTYVQAQGLTIVFPSTLHIALNETGAIVGRAGDWPFTLSTVCAAPIFP